MIPVLVHPSQWLSNPQHEWDKRGFRPHPETFRRIEAIRQVLESHVDSYSFHCPTDIPWDALHAIHDDALHTIYKLAEDLSPDEWSFPTSFPKAHGTTPPYPNRLEDAGYYCADTSTWLCKDTYQAVCWSAASAASGAELLAQGNHKVVYALCRPPGHHATKTVYGGYCYFNNSAIAAHTLRSHGNVAILDLDYHHGDGTQSIFYSDPSVLTVSIHADPTERFPYYTGFEDEQGRGRGVGHNLNIALKPEVKGPEYLDALSQRAIPRLQEANLNALVVAFGGDTLETDPVGDFQIALPDYKAMGEALATLNVPVLVVQEGGYNPDELGHVAHNFLMGLQG